jgi:hypothetical protein
MEKEISKRRDERRRGRDLLSFWVCTEKVAPNTQRTFDLLDEDLWRYAIEIYPLESKEVLIQTDITEDEKIETTLMFPTRWETLFYKLCYVDSEEDAGLKILTSREMVKTPYVKES